MNKRRMSVGKTVVLIICVVMFTVSSGFLIKHFVEIHKNKDTFEKLSQLVPSDDGSNSSDTPDYSKLLEMNSDLVGWITVPNTSINHPVVKTANNEYYLDHNFDKESDRRGAVFMDYRNNATELDSNTILYGHNCYDTTMFSELVKYESIDFYKKSPVFEFNTLEKKYKWKIYGVFITSAAASEDNGYVFYYNTPNVDENDFDGFIEEVNKRRLYTTDVDINSEDRLMILSTCVRNLDLKNKAGATTYRADGRIVILARAVRDGESAEVNTEKAYVNENPKYPQLWYDKNGTQNPYKDEKGWYPQEVIR